MLSTIDASFDYWRVEIGIFDCEKNALASYHNLYSYIRKLFGLKNGFFILRRAMDVILCSVKRWLPLISSSNIADVLETAGKQFNHIQCVVALQKEAVVAHYPINCLRFTESNYYLGHDIRIK